METGDCFVIAMFLTFAGLLFTGFPVSWVLGGVAVLFTLIATIFDTWFGTLIGLDYLRIIHMNDSKREFGSRKDRHEHIGKGEIGLEAFRNFVNDKRLKAVPMILETPKGEDMKEDIENLKVLRGLVKK